MSYSKKIAASINHSVLKDYDTVSDLDPMDTKILFFLVALAILALRFSPLGILNIIPGFGFIYLVSGIYLIIFSLYLLVKNLNTIKIKLESNRSKFNKT